MRCRRSAASSPPRPRSSWFGSPTASISAAAAISSRRSGGSSSSGPSPWSRAASRGARALAGADNAAGALTVKVLRAAGGAAETGTVRALDLKGLPLGDTLVHLQGRRARERGRAHAAGRDPQRHRAAGNRRRALGRRGGAARQALAPALDRRRHRLDRRHRAAAAGLDLLSHARARAVRRRTARRARLAGARR